MSSFHELSQTLWHLLAELMKLPAEKTATKLRIEAYLDKKEYEKSLKVSDKEFRELNISLKLKNPTEFCGHGKKKDAGFLQRPFC